MRIQTTYSNHTWSPQMGHEVKEQILEQLKLVSMNSAWGFACRDFVENRQSKSDPDYYELMEELRMGIEEGPRTMQVILGKAYPFFCNEIG